LSQPVDYDSLPNPFFNLTVYAQDVDPTHVDTAGRPLTGTNACGTPSRDDNGSAGHGSRVKWVNKSEWVTWVTRDPLTHDQVNKIPRTGYFVAVMMFDFESTST